MERDNIVLLVTNAEDDRGLLNERNEDVRKRLGCVQAQSLERWTVRDEHGHYERTGVPTF